MAALGHALVLASLAAFTLAAGPARAEPGNAARGGELFATHCAECHSVREGKDKKGPSLFGVLGRKAGQRDSFAYSDALRDSGITWTNAQMSAYIAEPRKVVPGGKMKYDGLPDAAARDDLIAYLAGSAGH